MTEATAGSSTPQDGERPLFSIVSAVYNVSRYLGEYIDSLEAQTFDLGRIQVILVDDGSTDDGLTVLREWADRASFKVIVLTQQNAGQAAARNVGLEQATGEWVTFIDPDDTVNPEFLSSVATFVARHPEAQFISTNMILHVESTGAFTKHPRAKMFLADVLIDLDVATSYIPNSATTSFMRRERIGGLRFNADLRPNFEDGEFAVRYLMAAPTRISGFLASAKYYYRKRSDQSSTLQTGISAVGRYDVVPREGYLALLLAAKEQWGTIPRWVQNTILYDISWYFSSEDQMANSASAIDGELGETFRATLARIAGLLSPDVVDSYLIRRLQPHWRDILLHGLDGGSWHTPYAVTNSYDWSKRLVRVLYRYIGDPPEETILVRGRPTTPAVGKTRRLDFFGETMMRERIMWVPAYGTLEVLLDGERVELITGWKGNPVRALGANAIANRFRKRRRRSRAALRQARPDPVRLLAARKTVKKTYAKAWVLMDRIHDANDSGEILFRWLRANRPDINAWFVVEKDTPDWKRLKADGYGGRLVAHGSLRWKLLMINAAHLISSHIDLPVVKPPGIVRHVAPQWKFTFLQHGVIKDDLSRWLNPKLIDVFVTSTPGEYESIAGDGSPYVFSAKEVKMTGLPRFDRLHEKAKQFSGDTCDLILVAPTWRNWLVPPLKPGSQRRVIDRHFFDTDYAQQWTAFLGSDQLSELAARTGKRIAFLPHPNIQPALDQMHLPESVLRLSFDGADVQEYFARAAVLVTDYSSMAFNTAYMDRPVVYFQFDAARVMAGGHVGRAGYFDYSRDGFGPVVSDVASAVAAVSDIAANDFASRPAFQERIDTTFPQRDGRCCARVTEAIEDLGRPLPKQRSGRPDEDGEDDVGDARAAARADVPDPDADTADLGEVSTRG